MMKRIWFSICAGAFVIACFFALTSVAHAASIPTSITIDPVGTIRSGQPFTVTGSLNRLVEGGTAGIPNRQVKLYIEPITTTSGVISKTFLVATVFSNKEGRLKWVVHKPLLGGHYRLYFWYQGSPQLWGSMATTDLYVIEAPAGKTKPTQRDSLPVQLSVAATTVPIEVGEETTVTVRLTSQSLAPLADYKVYFQMPGITQQRVTDMDGIAVFVIKKPLKPGQNIGRVLFRGKGMYLPAETPVQLTVKPPAQTTLTFDKGDKLIYVGDENAFVVRLATNRKPVIDQFVRFYLDGKQRYGARTDGDGKAILWLPRDMVAGQHVISVTFRGTYNLSGSTGTLPVSLLPSPFTLRAVPPLPNIKILVGEKLIQTDEQGIARLMVERIGFATVTVLPYESPDPNVRAEFKRWSDEVFSAARMINVINGKTYQIGFEVHHPIIQQYVEESTGREVSVARLGNIVLVDSEGEAIALNNSEVQWLKANRITRHDDTLVSSPVSYRMRNVTVDGVNVVNEGQQRFEIMPNARWTVKLQMYDIAVVSRDALFGFPTGNSVRVAYPMGQLRDVTLNTLGQMRIESLSRGSYTLTVQGAFGILTPTPISLSRSQDVQLAVISYLDIGVVAGTLTSVALFALFLGRPGVFAGLRRLVYKRTPST